MAVGGIGAMVLGSGEGGGLLFGVGTFGRPERAVTVGLGVAFDDDTRSDPVIMVGGELQLSNFVKLLSENYVVLGVEDAVVVSGGIRFFGDRLAADLALKDGLLRVRSMLGRPHGNGAASLATALGFTTHRSVGESLAQSARPRQCGGTLRLKIDTGKGGAGLAGVVCAMPFYKAPKK